MGLKPLDKETLRKRTDLVMARTYDDGMFDLAKQFASAEKIVIAAPHWDLSFPALLKIYIENNKIYGILHKELVKKAEMSE